MSEQPTPSPHRRRPRYSGTHPRKFDQKYKEQNPDKFPDHQQHVRSQGRTPAGSHVPVLMNEVLAALAPKPGERFVDCTLGYGGHALEIARRLGPTGVLIGLDIDESQLARTRERLTAIATAEPLARLALHHTNFAGLPKTLAAESIEQCDGILADLGVSSMQIDDPARGFSYKHDGPLDMRMSASAARTAADLLRTMTEPQLAEALRELGDEPLAELVASAIVLQRQRAPITRTRELVRIIDGVHARNRSRIAPDDQRSQPASRTFQALRMLVNDELSRLRSLLRVAPLALAPGGRIAIISFHSGEDRLVKHAFRDGVASGTFTKCSDEPLRAQPAETRDNPRAAPARLRWATKA